MIKNQNYSYINRFLKWNISEKTIYIVGNQKSFGKICILNLIKKKEKVSCEFCKENFNIKLVFNSFKVKNYFSNKDPIPDDLKSFLVYKFACASCSFS